jgi:glycosyltransferase involved in cell wall biosynthesis
VSVRILYLIGQLGTGGYEHQLCYLLESMDRERYRPGVVVWNASPGKEAATRIRTLGIPVYLLGQGLRPHEKLQYLRRLTRALVPEIVHSYSFYTNFAAWWCTLGAKAIPIGSIRNNFVSERRDAGAVLGSLSARWPAIQICNSFAARRMVEQSRRPFKPTQVHVVRNRIDVNSFSTLSSLPSESIVLAIGRLDHGKRWDRLIKAIALLKSKGVKGSLRLAGDGPLLGELRGQAECLGVGETIEFLGRRNDIRELLTSSTFLAHSAEEEGCPNVVMEAMACGRAVVSTDAGDIPRLVEDGKTGFVVCRGQNQALADRLMTLITDPDLCMRMGEAGRTKAEREFGLQWLAPETLHVYRASGWKA